MSTETVLNEALRAMVDSGGPGGRLVVEAPPLWLIFHREGARIRTEPISSHYLPKGRRFGLEAVQGVRAEGFTQVSPFKTLQRVDGVEEIDAIAARAARVLHLLGLEGALQLHQHQGPSEDTENPALLDAIRGLAKSRAPELRRAMYREMLSARLLLRLDDQGAPLVVETLQGWPVYAAFTDLLSLRLKEPRVGNYRVWRGRELFPALMDLKVGSLLINPGGRLGGELYRNEVETLARSTRAFGGPR